MHHPIRLFIGTLFAGLVATMSASAGAEEIVVSNYAVSANLKFEGAQGEFALSFKRLA